MLLKRIFDKIYLKNTKGELKVDKSSDIIIFIKYY